MRAYFAMIWNNKDPQAVQTAHDLQACINQPTASSLQCVKASGFAFYDLSGNAERCPTIEMTLAGQSQGAIFGTVFERCDGAGVQHPITQLNEYTMARLRQSEGQAMITEFWGSYIAFIRSGQGVVVIADPTASLPCFYTEQGGVTFVLSHLEKCDFLDKSLFSINYAFIAKLLIYDKIQTGETGLTEIRELLGGQRLRITPQGTQVDDLWNPRDIALNVYEPPLDQAVEALQETTKNVVQSCANSFEAVTVQLSGGLDSSIVLGCLADKAMNRDVNALHHIVGSDDLPEDQYAQLAADAASCDLIKVMVPSAAHIADVMDHPLSVRPYRAFALPSFVANLGEAQSDIRRIIFTGQGGDHLFFQTRSALGFADYLERHGLSGGALSELTNAARLSGKSIWRVLRETVPYVIRKTQRSAIIEDIEARRTRVNQHVSMDDLRNSLPSWATDPKGLLPAKFEQVSHLLHMVHFRETLDQMGDRAIVHPLIAQPLIELCLQLPIYLLCIHGRSRGLARLAFQGMLPEPIRLRTTKGSTSRYTFDYMMFNHGTMVDALLDGELVEAGMIRRTDVEVFLRQDHYAFQTVGRMMLVYYAIEAWLRSWKFLLSGANKGRRPGIASSFTA